MKYPRLWGLGPAPDPNPDDGSYDIESYDDLIAVVHKRYRTHRITYIDVAAAMRAHANDVYRWVNGIRAPRANRAIQLARAFGFRVVLIPEPDTDK